VNPYQPSANDHTVLQRIDDRRAAASNYRLARATSEGPNPGRLSGWRCAIGNQLVALGESLGAPKRDRLETV
jgi:hypothetical protein